MKQCPVCKTTYTDVTLRYCLADGNTLVDLNPEQPTVVRQGGHVTDGGTIAIARGPQMRIDIPQDMVQTPQSFQPPPTPSGGSSGGLLKVLLVILVGIFTILTVAVATLIYLNRSGPDIAADISNYNGKTPALPTPASTINETDELRDQIANLEKLLNDQKRNNQPSNIPLSLPNQSTATTSARVNSPGDGFLALRTFPNNQAGDRILKIPHGATVSVGGCLNSSRIGNKTGRWCRASYDGYSGWVFDSFLVY
jgi:hypothetical protein